MDPQALLRQAEQFSEEVIIKAGELQPMFILHSKDATQEVISSGWSNTTEKRLAQTFVTLCCIAHDAAALTAMSEVWTTTETAGNLSALPPSKSSRRREMVFVVVVYRINERRQCTASCREIRRGADGAITGLGPNEAGNDRDFAGAMIEILPEQPPTAAQKALARAVLDPAGRGP
jgi:hypothetical protein